MSGGISQLGEFGLIRKITSRLKSHDPNVILGPGDDCAVVRPTSAPILLSTDMLVEGVHFRRQWISWKDLGLKAIRVNISDIAAMGGKPLYFLVALGLPKNFRMAAVERLMLGMKKGAEGAGASIVGGNLSRSRQLVISVAVFGVASKKRFLLRSGARVGDFIYVTGTLGKSAVALAAGRHLVPPLRLKVGQTLARMDSVHSLIDISDGLVGDLGHILEESGVGAEVTVDRIPMPKGANLGGGEDYELLFTASPRVKLPKKIHGVSVTCIGKITRKRGVLVSSTSRSTAPFDMKTRCNACLMNPRGRCSERRRKPFRCCRRHAAGSGLKLMDGRGHRVNRAVKVSAFKHF